MFRMKKRNFSVSLRDSPVKLGSEINSSPSKVSASPLKRLKLTDNSFQLSSTLLRDVSQLQSEETNTKTESTNLLLKTPEKSLEPAVETKRADPIETPPPTPDAVTESAFEKLIKKRDTLIDESKELDQKLEEKMTEIKLTRSDIAGMGIQRLDYEDMLEVVTMIQKEIRDQLNEIFYPGRELSEAAKCHIDELQLKHQKRLDKLDLELNNLIDRSQKSIADKLENLEHEIDLHQRTLMTKEMEKQNAEKKSAERQNVEKEIAETLDEQIDKVDKEISAEFSDGKLDQSNGHDESCNAANQTDEIAGDENEDCIILDGPNSIISMEGSDDISLDASELKANNNLDDDATDIEDDQGEESRSFTPCQAQRPVG